MRNMVGTGDLDSSYPKQGTDINISWGYLKTILDLNDRDAKSFCEIADALEKMYLADRI
jgi:hypothetical protein